MVMTMELRASFMYKCNPPIQKNKTKQHNGGILEMDGKGLQMVKKLFFVMNI